MPDDLITVLFLGDVIGKPGRLAAAEYLRETRADFKLINGENMAGGLGITPRVAIEMLEAGLAQFTVDGFDMQAACIETARTGQIPVAGLPRYVTAHVEPVVMEHLRFAVLDVIAQPIPGRYDFLVCRNFLGYFRPEIGRALVGKLLGALDRPGCLLVDAFITRKHPELFEGLPRDAELPFFWPA